VLAVRHDAAPIAVLAVLGGLTPALSSRGGDAGESREALFAYLAVSSRRTRRRPGPDWRGLEGLAFTGTWILFAAWYHRTAAPGRR
jgi:hypothetical protein